MVFRFWQVIRSILKKIENNEVDKILVQILDVKSVSGNERDLADMIYQYLSTFPHLSIERNGNNIIAKTNFSRDKRFILAGHIDTVPISIVTNNFPSTVVEELKESGLEKDVFIKGRGSVDMKGGVAVMLKLASLSNNPKHDITFVFYDNEEVEADKNGLGKIVRQKKDSLIGQDANKIVGAILLEPTDNFIEGGCNGTLRFDVIVKGKTAHSARPYKGDNAIHKMSNVLDILNKYNQKQHFREVDGLKYLESLNAVKINGGIATNMIPDLVTIHINYRFAPDKGVQEAKDFITNLFKGYDIIMVDESSGARPGLNNFEMQQFINTCIETTQKDVKAKLGWTDVARFYSLDIPALNFGPGDPNLCHHDDEKISISDLHQNLECFVKFFIDEV